MSAAEISVAFSACILPSRLRMIMMKGIAPRISMTENKISVTEKISFRSSMAKICCKAKTKMPDLRPAFCCVPNLNLKGYLVLQHYLALC